MFLVRRKIFPSYRLTSSSKAAASPARAAATRRCSSSRTIVDGRGCGLDALKVSKGPQNWAAKPVSAMNIPLNIRPPIPCSVFDEGERDSEISGKATLRYYALFLAPQAEVGPSYARPDGL